VRRFLPDQRVTVIAGPCKGVTGQIINAAEAERRWAEFAVPGHKFPTITDNQDWLVPSMMGYTPPIYVETSHLALTVD